MLITIYLIGFLLSIPVSCWLSHHLFEMGQGDSLDKATGALSFSVIWPLTSLSLLGWLFACGTGPLTKEEVATARVIGLTTRELGEEL